MFCIVVPEMCSALPVLTCVITDLMGWSSSVSIIRSNSDLGLSVSEHWADVSARPSSVVARAITPFTI